MSRVILWSPTMGVYLGHAMGLGFWSKMENLGLISPSNDIADIVERLRIHLLKLATSVVDLIEPQDQNQIPTKHENAATETAPRKPSGRKQH